MTSLRLLAAPQSGQGAESAHPIASASHDQPHIRHDHPPPAAPLDVLAVAPSLQPAPQRVPRLLSHIAAPR